jgi:hypothetical protein
MNLYQTFQWERNLRQTDRDPRAEQNESKTGTPYPARTTAKIYITITLAQCVSKTQEIWSSDKL